MASAVSRLAERGSSPAETSESMSPTGVITGTGREIRQLINLYLERVIVYREHVEVILRMLPIFCLEGFYLIDKENGTISVRKLDRSIMLSSKVTE